MDEAAAIQVARDWAKNQGDALTEHCHATLITADCSITFEPPELAATYLGWWLLIFYSGTSLDGEQILRVNDASAAVEWLAGRPRRGWLHRIKQIAARI